MRVYGLQWETPEAERIRKKMGNNLGVQFFNTKRGAIERAKSLEYSLEPAEHETVTIKLYRISGKVLKDDLRCLLSFASDQCFPLHLWEEIKSERRVVGGSYKWPRGITPAHSYLKTQPRHEYNMGAKLVQYFGQLGVYDLYWNPEEKTIEIIRDRVDDIIGYYGLDELPIKWPGMTLEQMKEERIGAVNAAYKMLCDLNLNKNQKTKGE
tara:strand:+ start:502 stop:1131 length:630 start_codon:yes stop_codon:yes gene_type:complete